jgi:GNAT superfamily N-acetyltransferase
MPRPNPVLEMSFDEFEVMEHRLGWKHEYIDGTALLSVQESAVVDWQRQIGPDFAPGPPLPTGLTVRSVCIDDQEALATLFRESFEDSMEYSGCNEEYFRQDAQDSIRSFFGLTTIHKARQNDIGLCEASFLIEHGDIVVAAILVRPIRMGTIVEPIMVLPSYRRMGLSQALLHASLRALARAGKLKIFSQSHLVNPISFAWHCKQGFQEVPTIYSASHRTHHFDWLAKHYDHMGRKEIATETRAMADHWRNMRDQLNQQGAYRPLV